MRFDNKRVKPTYVLRYAPQKLDGMEVHIVLTGYIFINPQNRKLFIF